jgi:hypothetical protein
MAIAYGTKKLPALVAAALALVAKSPTPNTRRHAAEIAAVIPLGSFRQNRPQGQRALDESPHVIAPWLSQAHGFSGRRLKRRMKSVCQVRFCSGLLIQVDTGDLQETRDVADIRNFRRRGDGAAGSADKMPAANWATGATRRVPFRQYGN